MFVELANAELKGSCNSWF